MISLVTKRDSKFPSELRTNICPSATSTVAALPSASTVKRAPVAVPVFNLLKSILPSAACDATSSNRI